MIDLDLAPRDSELVQLARSQAAIGRNYARHYDRAKDDFVPDALAEAEGEPDVRALLEQYEQEISGPALLDALIYLEEVWGTIPFRKSSNKSAFLGSKLINALGEADQIDRWGHLCTAIALTEPDAGSDPSRIRTTAIFDEASGEWLMNGEKIFISLAQSAEAVLVFSRFQRGAEKGLGIFVVEKGTPGLSVGHQLDKLGQRAWDTANLVFCNCRLPGQAKLAGSMKQTLAIFNRSRPLVSAIALGFSRAALDFTKEKLVEAGIDICYRQNSSRLPALADRLIRLEALYESAYLTFLHTKWLEDKIGPDKIEASMTKADAAIAARRITAGCLELLGAEATSERHLLEMWLRDARVCDIYEGPGEVNRLVIAREMLGYTAVELN